MGFPKGASIPFAIILIGAGVNTPATKWFRLIGFTRWDEILRQKNQ
jgi:hypothetical protein